MINGGEKEQLGVWARLLDDFYEWCSEENQNWIEKKVDQIAQIAVDYPSLHSLFGKANCSKVREGKILEEMSKREPSPDNVAAKILKIKE